MKFDGVALERRCCMSPSTRREWIEIAASNPLTSAHGGLPPHGGSGLKYIKNGIRFFVFASPSTRREWIEIVMMLRSADCTVVSLHTEGVD